MRWRIFMEGSKPTSYAASCFTPDGEEILRVGGFGSAHAASLFIVAYLMALTTKGAQERQQKIMEALALATPAKPEEH